MKKIEKTVPNGTRDLIFEAVVAQRRIENKLLALYRRLGFRLIYTPTLEFYDIFDHQKKYIDETTIYKFSDTDGRLVVLRPDNTSPMARVVSSKLRDEELPLKLSYSQYVYRKNEAYNAKRSEILQSGVEIIGGETMAEDLRCLFTAFSSMSICSDTYKIEIGHAGFFDALLSEFSIADEEKKNLKKFMSVKNSSGFAFSLNEVNKKAVELARILPRLCGDRSVFKEARILANGTKVANEILDYLESIYDAFEEAGYGDRIMVDLGIVQTIEYYTGIVFRGYIDGIGEAALSGGRYDNLLANFGDSHSACGFAINLSDIADIMPIENTSIEPNLTFKNGSDGIKEAKEYLKRVRKKV